MGCKSHTLLIDSNALVDSQNISADYWVGNGKFAQGKHDEAEHHWSTALKHFMRESETHPMTVAARLKLSCAKMKLGRYDEAM